MFFKIMSAYDCLAIRLDKVDVVRLEYNTDLEDNKRHVVTMYQANQETPVAEYDVSKLTLEQRHDLFNRITNALQLDHIAKEDELKLLTFDCR